MNFDKPGIITSNIDAVAGTHNAQQKRYELCLDGKRLTVGFGSKLGDVDLSIIAQIAPLSFQGSHRTHPDKWGEVAARFSGHWVVTSMFA